MRERGAFVIGYYLYWLVYFLFVKAVFLLYHREFSAELPGELILGIFRHGLGLDLSFSAYLTAIPFLFVALTPLIPYKRWLPPFLLIFNSIVLFVVTFLCTADLELFRVWGFRLDASPLAYINTPGEMFVSVGSSPLFLLFILNILINLFFSFLYRFQLHPYAKSFAPLKPIWTLPLLAITSLLFIPIRGGVQEIPINQSSAYFSRNHFANQAGINVAWNFFHALSKWKNKEENPYTFMSPAIADSLLQTLYPDSLPPAKQVLNTPRPNIILIIWESFTAKLAEPLGGAAGVTPNFTRLSKDGLLFKNLYASGDRTDKGLVALLSGYPSQPITTIIKAPQKSKKLPQLSINLGRQGYHTAFYYGGELGFANLRSYLTFGDWHTITGVEAYNEADLNSKWGAHDEVVMKKVLQELDTMSQPFLASVLTLSSHEPFDLPANSKSQFPGQHIDNLFMSSHYYTDSVIGAFVDAARQKPWWDNTLIIIVADHGHPDPGPSQVFEPRKFSIPMLWLGGALEAKGTTWQRTLSQTDLAATLLRQMGLPATDFPWSQDGLSPGARHFAPYFFKDGVGFITDSSYTTWDNVGKLVIEQSKNAGEPELQHAKGYLQKAFTDYLEK